MSRVLVTGGTGFIGRHCVAELLQSGHEVHVVSRQAQPRTSAAHGWHQVDLFNEAEACSVVNSVRPDSVIHLAWEATPGRFWNSDENVQWVQATLSLLRAYARAGGGRVVIAGSCAEYDWRGGTFRESTTPLEPASLYGVSKVALFRLVESIAEQWGLSFAWGRVFFMYGPGEPPDRLVTSVVQRLLNGERALCTHGGQVRDYLYVGDVSRAFVALLESDFVGAVNIGSGIPVAVRDIVLGIGKQMGRSDLIALGALPGRPTDPPIIVADVERLKYEVGWEPTIDLEQGLKRTLDGLCKS